ncbi:MAG: heme exporter protein CcmB [Deltaproteobacteria bacterium]|nr:heme exporter protein CcmB [Deltaproteobacteria bacterium]
MSFLGSVLAIFMKDVAIELRSFEILFSTALFALLVVVLSAFAFGLGASPGPGASAGALWIAIAFSGVLALGRTFVRERELGVWTALIMTPAPRSAVFLGKVLGVAAFLTAVELVLVPIVQLFFHVALIENLLSIGLVLVLGTAGYAAVGTLFAAMTVRSRLSDLLLGVIIFPLVSPILIAAVMSTEALLRGAGLGSVRDYVGLLVTLDAIYIVGGLWLFDPLMED